MGEEKDNSLMSGFEHTVMEGFTKADSAYPHHFDNA